MGGARLPLHLGESLLQPPTHRGTTAPKISERQRFRTSQETQAERSDPLPLPGDHLIARSGSLAAAFLEGLWHTPRSLTSLVHVNFSLQNAYSSFLHPPRVL